MQIQYTDDLRQIRSQTEQFHLAKILAKIQIKLVGGPLQSFLREMAEAVLALAVIITLGEFLPRSMITSHLFFCAFFLVVFVVAVRCHKAAAYTTGLLAAGSYGFLFWQRVTHHAAFPSSSTLLEPFLLVVCSLLVSSLLSVQRRQFSTAQEQSTLSEEKLAETQQSYQTALAINTELERQIGGQTLSIASVSDQMAQVCKLQGSERYRAIVNLVASALQISSCALYMDDNGQMRSTAGQPQTSERPSTLKLTNPLIGRVLKSRRIYTIRDLLLEGIAVPQDTPAMAGPLLDSDGQVSGIIVVENLPLLKFTANSIYLFRSLLDLIAIPLQTAKPLPTSVTKNRKVVALKFLPLQTAKPLPTSVTVQPKCWDELLHVMTTEKSEVDADNKLQKAS